MGLLVVLLAVACAGLALRGYAAHARSGGVTRGLAGGMAITRAMSLTAVRRGAFVTRPNTHVTRSTPPHKVGIEICLIRRWRAFKRFIYAGFRDIVLIIAPPGSGKTGMLGGHVQDAPGACLAASARTDLYEKTIASRNRRPVYVFNPHGLGGITNTLRWSPVWGCADPAYAMRLAAILVGAGPTADMKDAGYWESNSIRVLRCLLAAADHFNADMFAVVRWIGNFGGAKPSSRPADILAAAGNEDWAADLREMQKMPEKSRGSIASTLAMTMQFMADPKLAALATPDRDDQFDPAEFLRTGATVYVIGRHREHDPVGPLFAALTGVLFDTAGDLAERSTGQRLDPPMMMVLDEVTNIFRIALDQWTSYSGGLGIPMVIAAQGHHQLRKSFGDEGAKAVWSNSAVKVAFGGDMDRETLESLSMLTGDRPTQMGSDQRRPILTPRQIVQLPDGHVLVLRRNTPPIIGVTRPVWERKNPPVAEPLVTAPAQPRKPDLRIVRDEDREAS